MSATIIMINPKFPHNVGSAVRAASCYGATGVYYTGDRLNLGDRLPREERMKAYQDVEWGHREQHRVIDSLPGFTPVAIELLPGCENLADFDHPDKAVYVFGPEDGSIPAGIRRHCHRFVAIPSAHCLNLSAAVYVVLYDRAIKRHAAGVEALPTLDGEQRGWWHSPAIEEGAFPHTPT